MCLSETDSHKQKKMTSESPRYIPTTTAASSYKSSDRSTTHLDGPTNTRGIIRASTHDLLHGAQRLENPQDLYRQHRNEHLEERPQHSTTTGLPARAYSGACGVVRRSGSACTSTSTTAKARHLLEQNMNAAKRAGTDRGGLTATTSARDGGGGDDDGGDNYTHVPAPAAGIGATTAGGAPSFTTDLPIRGNHGDHRDHGDHLAHRHRERHSLRAPIREPKERVTTYVQDNIIMRISSNGSQSSSPNPSYSGSGAHAPHHSNLDNDLNGIGIGHPSSSASSSNEQRGAADHRGADHRRKWYRERMARIIQDIEPGLPPSSSSSSSSSFGSGHGRGYSGAGGAGGYVYSGMGTMGIGSAGGGAGGLYVYSGMVGMGGGGGMGAGAGGYDGGSGSGSGSGGYAPGAGAGAGYGTATNGTNGRDSGYGSFSRSGGGSYGHSH
ncbi:hypothetical protein N0V85_008638 [Neurospora sp. IMI 360204]|nr:hypothetical protein N0V85_008638 [Neurospora sp. IMI 360204]